MVVPSLLRGEIGNFGFKRYTPASIAMYKKTKQFAICTSEPIFGPGVVKMENFLLSKYFEKLIDSMLVELITFNTQSWTLVVTLVTGALLSVGSGLELRWVIFGMCVFVSTVLGFLHFGIVRPCTRHIAKVKFLKRNQEGRQKTFLKKFPTY